MATIGYTTIGSSERAGVANEKRACKFNVPKICTVISLSVYGHASSATASVTPAIYNDNAGAPNALIGVGTAVSCDTTSGWDTASFSGGLAVNTAANHWLTMHSGSPADNLHQLR